MRLKDEVLSFRSCLLQSNMVQTEPWLAEWCGTCARNQTLSRGLCCRSSTSSLSKVSAVTTVDDVIDTLTLGAMQFGPSTVSMLQKLLGLMWPRGRLELNCPRGEFLVKLFNGILAHHPAFDYFMATALKDVTEASKQVECADDRKVKRRRKATMETEASITSSASVLTQQESPQEDTKHDDRDRSFSPSKRKRSRQISEPTNTALKLMSLILNNLRSSIMTLPWEILAFLNCIMAHMSGSSQAAQYAAVAQFRPSRLCGNPDDHSEAGKT